MEIGSNSGIVLAVFSVLLLFGVFYNQLIGWLERKHYIEGYTWLAVVVGNLVTLALMAILDWRAALLALICFAISGTPMGLGSIARHVATRSHDQNSFTTGEHGV